MSILKNLKKFEIPLSEVEVTLEQLESRLMVDILEKVISLSKTDSNVVISGEQGTGKEWIAKLICQLDKANYNYMAHISFDHVKQEDLQDNLFKEIESQLTNRKDCNKVALIIDNFSDLDSIGQLKLLSKLIRFKDNGLVETARYIFIVQKDWLQGNTKESIWPYICELLTPVSILIPPLREHREDIIPLVSLFINQHEKSPDFCDSEETIQISDRALYKCINYDWPGNLRQLKNAVTHACYSKKGEIIEPEDLPVSIRCISTLYRSIDRFTKLEFSKCRETIH
ncbi:MAG: sigma 54-interacting transcriptional regulator [Gracilimonas sp.]|nr:sigma 54-interacting transcriptional regulator [Gracilimonas sp.]